MFSLKRWLIVPRNAHRIYYIFNTQKRPCFVFLYLFLYSLSCLDTQNRGKFSITACRPWGLISLVDCDSSRSDRFLSIFLSLPLFPRRKIWCLQANPKFIFISDGTNFILLIQKRTGYLWMYQSNLSALGGFFFIHDLKNIAFYPSI